MSLAAIAAVPQPEWQVLNEDCLEVLKRLPDNCLHSMVTDPPAGIGFMNKSWDSYSTDLPPPDFLNWFAGFTDGEGCFSVHKKSHDGTLDTYDCQFSITLRRDDKPILEEIKRTLRIGTVADAKAAETGNVKARYCVSSKADCLRLVEILRAAPLRAKKALDLEIWVEALTAWIHHKPREWEDMKEARERLMSARHFTDYGKVAGPPDRRAFHTSMMLAFREALRVLKPGAHGVVWALPRTSHWTATALEDAGFEIRDVITHHFGSGFPKSLSVSKAIDEAAGAKRQVIEARTGGVPGTHGGSGHYGHGTDRSVTADATAAAAWHGWGTAIKPASEHWILCRKPLAGTVAANVQAHGTGALNIDECRIDARGDQLGGGRLSGPTAVSDGWDRPWMHDPAQRASKAADTASKVEHAQSQGRWPANLLLSHSGDCFDGGCGEGCPVAGLDNQSGTLKSGGANGVRKASDNNSMSGPNTARAIVNGREPDQGGASRFFYCPKPSTAEREEGLAHLPKKRGAEITERAEDSAGIQNPRAGAGRTSQGRANHHPTVKSIALMKYLVTLVTPPGGIVLDLFCGSGTTGIAAVLGGWSFLGVEKDPEYAAIARGRIAHWLGKQSS